MKKFKLYALIAAIVFVVGSYFTSPYWTHGVADVVVTNTAVKNYNNQSKYLVFTDHGVFENSDSWSYFKFDSSDIQGKLMQGGRFKISYYGFRIPIVSEYQNIISVERR